MFREFINESADAHIGSEQKLREQLLVGNYHSDPEVIRQCCNASRIVGSLEDIPALNALE